MCSMICYTEAWRCCLGPAHKEINIDDFCLFRSDGTKDSGKMDGSGRLGKTQGTYAKHRDVDCRCKTILHTRSKQVTWYFTPSQPVGLYRGDHTRKIFTHSCHCMCHQTQMRKTQQMQSEVTSLTLKLQHLMHSKSLLVSLITVHLKHLASFTPMLKMPTLYLTRFTPMLKMPTPRDTSPPPLGQSDHDLIQLIP